MCYFICSFWFVCSFFDFLIYILFFSLTSFKIYRRSRKSIFFAYILKWVNEKAVRKIRKSKKEHLNQKEHIKGAANQAQ